MRHDSTVEAEVLIAPHEVRELLTRLTENTVEAVPVDEVRTLGGLSLKTGISVDRLRISLRQIRKRKRRKLSMVAVTLLACAGLLGAYQMVSDGVAPKTVPAFTVQEWDRTGLVSLGDVTYGHDSGQVYVDPTFEPAVPLPDGISISLQIGEVLWGAGDHRAVALDRPLTPQEEQNLRATIESLIRFSRDRARIRSIPTSSKGYKGSLTMLSFAASSSTTVEVSASGEEREKDNLHIEIAARQLVDNLQHLLRQRQAIDRR